MNEFGNKDSKKKKNVRKNVANYSFRKNGGYEK